MIKDILWVKQESWYNLHYVVFLSEERGNSVKVESFRIGNVSKERRKLFTRPILTVYLNEKIYNKVNKQPYSITSLNVGRVHSIRVLTYSLSP